MRHISYRTAAIDDASALAIVEAISIHPHLQFPNFGPISKGVFPVCPCGR